MATHHPGITTESILAAGLELGLEDLSVSAVARRMGVTAPALYRHIASRDALDILVGEHLLEGVHLEDRAATSRDSLLHLGAALIDVCLATPGMAAYLHRGFPRGAQSRRIQDASRAPLLRLGHSPGAAGLLAATTATLAISLAAAEETSARTPSLPPSVQAQELAALVPAEIDLDARSRLLLTLGPCIDGLLAALPADREVGESLRAMTEAYL